MGIAKKVSKVKGQGHNEVKCTFPAEGYPLTFGHPSVGHPAEAYQSTMWHRGSVLYIVSICFGDKNDLQVGVFGAICYDSLSRVFVSSLWHILRMVVVWEVCAIFPDAIFPGQNLVTENYCSAFLWF